MTNLAKTPNISNQMYWVDKRINQALEQNTDPETGEIAESAWEQIEQMFEHRHHLVQTAGQTYKQLLAEAAYWKQEKDRIAGYQKKAEKIAEKLKELLMKVVPEGEKVKSPELEISWRKSTAVEINELEVDYEALCNHVPPLAEKVITYKADKNMLKGMDKINIGFKGVEIVERNNMQIK